jgi:hypothetical protein
MLLLNLKLSSPSCRASVVSSSSQSSDVPFVTVQVKEPPSAPVSFAPAPENKKDADSVCVESTTLLEVDVIDQLVFKQLVSRLFCCFCSYFINFVHM